MRISICHLPIIANINLSGNIFWLLLEKQSLKSAVLKSFLSIEFIRGMFSNPVLKQLHCQNGMVLIKIMYLLRISSCEFFGLTISQSPVRKSENHTFNVTSNFSNDNMSAGRGILGFICGYRSLKCLLILQWCHYGSEKLWIFLSEIYWNNVVISILDFQLNCYLNYSFKLAGKVVSHILSKNLGSLLR